MSTESAGLLLYRRRAQKLEVLLVHPGGPYWARRDAGAWSIPKGEIGRDEVPLEAARREFEEELGQAPPSGDAISLGTVRQAGGKVVHAWAVAGDLDAADIKTNSFQLEWPPRSGRMRTFPEVDKAAWFDVDAALAKIIDAQGAFIRRLADLASL